MKLVKWQKRSTEETTRRNQKWQTLFWYRCSYCCLKNVLKTVHIWWTTKHTFTAVYQLTYLCTFFVVHLFSSFSNKRRQRLQLAAFRKNGRPVCLLNRSSSNSCSYGYTHQISFVALFWSKEKLCFALSILSLQSFKHGQRKGKNIHKKAALIYTGCQLQLKSSIGGGAVRVGLKQLTSDNSHCSFAAGRLDNEWKNE